jgi:hypothetical protein
MTNLNLYRESRRFSQLIKNELVIYIYVVYIFYDVGPSLFFLLDTSKNLLC